MVYGSNSGQLSDGVYTTTMMQSSVTTPSASPMDPNVLANLIQSGFIPPLQRWLSSRTSWRLSAWGV